MHLNNKKYWQIHFVLSIFILAITPLSATQNPLTTTLFQNKFFVLSTDSSLLCQTSETGFMPNSRLVNVINFYEHNNPKKLRQHAVSVLTNHNNLQHLEDLAEIKFSCNEAKSRPMCILENYWENKEAALRVLALFYDTKTIIKHGENYQARRFTTDHLRVIEKSIRKIPIFMRQQISRAKPLKSINKVIKNLSSKTQILIKQAFPADFATSIWTDDTHPLMLTPGLGFQSHVVAQVYNGQNLIIFTVKTFDKAKDGTLYRDINLGYLVDFRIPIIVHEIAHIIDNFYFWNQYNELYYFYRYRKMSTDTHIVRLITQAKLSLWPSKWFVAFEHLQEVNDGRYNGRIQEKLAELVAQYILIPERLKQSTPETYTWLHDDVFNKIEYKGYDTCPMPIIKVLNWWELAIAKMLGDIK